MNKQIATPILPLNISAVQLLEQALTQSASKAILLEINNAIYQLSREGQWIKFSLLTKKRTIKKSTIFETIAEVYNQALHGHSWRISANQI